MHSVGNNPVQRLYEVGREKLLLAFYRSINVYNYKINGPRGCKIRSYYPSLILHCKCILTFAQKRIRDLLQSLISLIPLS